VPVAAQLDLKALAAAVGGKKAAMADVNAAERATGYVAGGISPLGQRRRLRVVIDSAALDFPTVFCSAGRRGLEIELTPGDLVRAASATVAPISRPQPADPLCHSSPPRPGATPDPYPGVAAPGPRSPSKTIARARACTFSSRCAKAAAREAPISRRVQLGEPDVLTHGAGLLGAPEQDSDVLVSASSDACAARPGASPPASARASAIAILPAASATMCAKKS